ncbi:carbohydrate kinase family protein [Glycomyces sp. TRM65418]|uniref:carbohydrate kinase family protein n=1 Tax=Glycomyces sp. TRM65418 TaxID=2867006 RepID=UPI001CE6F560|nr:carbohydrate kinase family protein [Glycomyces sp. TRM65418]MCC3762308.1 carbohydrate kinase family protein [Glycomyces sp. TRM65418]QZD56362.1 carbohydrate kinase family protein [Glycomyces sp. TRM65418]
MLDILVVGGVGVDTIVRVPEIAIGDGDSSHVEPIRDYVAHTGNGVALGCLRLGLATRFIDFIGDDDQGALVRRHYEAHGLDFRYRISERGTSRSVNLVDDRGRRFSFYDYRHDPDLRMPAEFYAPHLAEAAHVHVSITNHTRDALAAVPDDVPVSTDLHGWDGEAEHQKAFALRADLVTMSAARLADPEKTLRRVLDHGRADLVVATDGEHGGCFMERGGSFERYAAIDPVADLGAALPAWASWRPVDSNGAGDAFTSGLLWARRNGADTKAMIDAGRLAGAYACATEGTSTSLISEALLTESLAALPK